MGLRPTACPVARGPCGTGCLRAVGREVRSTRALQGVLVTATTRLTDLPSRPSRRGTAFWSRGFLSMSFEGHCGLEVWRHQPACRAWTLPAAWHFRMPHNMSCPSIAASLYKYSTEPRRHVDLVRHRFNA